MIAFVLSGGGNRGPLEVGALQALFAHEVVPDLLVGTSAGAVNAALIAADPSLVGALTLGQIWRSIRKKDVFPGNPLTMAWRVLVGKDSLISGGAIHRLILDNLPPGVETFGDLPVRLYLTAADLHTATLYLFGDDPTARLVDAAMASTALPITLPPYDYQGHQLVDGGVVANVPIEIAMERGATEIYAVDLGYSGEPDQDAHGVISIGQHVLRTMIYQQLLDDLAEAAEDPTLTLHHVRMPAFGDVSMWDFSRTDEMIQAGRETMNDYLSSPQPVTSALQFRQLTTPPEPTGIPGAVPYVPRWRRG